MTLFQVDSTHCRIIGDPPSLTGLVRHVQECVHLNLFIKCTNINWRSLHKRLLYRNFRLLFMIVIKIMIHLKILFKQGHVVKYFVCWLPYIVSVDYFCIPYLLLFHNAWKTLKSVKTSHFSYFFRLLSFVSYNRPIFSFVRI